MTDLCTISFQFMFEIYQENIGGMSSSEGEMTIKSCKKDAKKGVVTGVFVCVRAYSPTQL